MKFNSFASILAVRDSIYATDFFLIAACHLDLFSFIDNQRPRFADICKHYRIHERPGDVLMSLLRSWGLVTDRGGKFYLTKVAGQFLTHQSKDNLLAYFAQDKNREFVQALLKVLKTDKPHEYKASGLNWQTAMNNKKFARDFSLTMDLRGKFLAREIVKKAKLRGAKKMLDIGGSSGVYSHVFQDNFPSLRATVLDLPAVIKVNRPNYIKNQLGYIDCDMFRSNFPDGYDVHFYSNVIHDWGEEKVELLFKKSYSALPVGGKIIIHDAFLNDAKAKPTLNAEYSVLLMLLTEGKVYSFREIELLLRRAGFKNIVRNVNIVANRSLVTASK